MERLRLLTAGESHGARLAAVLEGLPAGLAIDTQVIDRDLSRRRGGYGRGQRVRSIERDFVRFVAGLRFGETIGAPLLIEVDNADHEHWREVMDTLPREHREEAAARALRRPRPGHADLAGVLKYGRSDIRDVLERASARTTAVRVAAGGVAKALLASIGVEVYSFVTKIGGVEMAASERPLRQLAQAAAGSDVSCPDPEAGERMRARIDEARKAGDTLGGAFMVGASGVPAGWGSYSEWYRRLDGRVAQALMSIPAVKAVEIGLGAAAADVPGSEAHDAIGFDPETRGNGAGGFTRPTNRAGGIEGGVSNGSEISARVTMKPIATLARPLPSVDLDTKAPSEAAYERSDVCAVPACAVIAESALALCLADAALETYGGDTLQDFVTAHHLRLERYGRA